MEKVVSDRRSTHLIKQSLYEPLQYPYRANLGTETALYLESKMTFYNILTIEKVSLIPAFDTNDHTPPFVPVCPVTLSGFTLRISRNRGESGEKCQECTTANARQRPTTTVPDCDDAGKIAIIMQYEHSTVSLRPTTEGSRYNYVYIRTVILLASCRIVKNHTVVRESCFIRSDAAKNTHNIPRMTYG